MSGKKKNTGKPAKVNAEAAPAPRKKTSWKRVVLLTCAVVVVAALAWMGVILFGNNYKKNATEMKVNTLVAQRLALAMLNDYQENWLRVETEKLGKNEKGEWVSTDNPKQLIAWRQQYFKNNGGEKALQQLLQEIDANLEDMRLTPGTTHRQSGRLPDRHVYEHGQVVLGDRPGTRTYGFQFLGDPR